MDSMMHVFDKNNFMDFYVMYVSALDELPIMPYSMVCIWVHVESGNGLLS